MVTHAMGGEPLPALVEIGQQLGEHIRAGARFVLSRVLAFDASRFTQAETDTGPALHIEELAAVGGLTVFEKTVVPAEDPDEVAKRDGVNRTEPIRPHGSGGHSPRTDAGKQDYSGGRTTGKSTNPNER